MTQLDLCSVVADGVERDAGAQMLQLRGELARQQRTHAQQVSATLPYALAEDTHRDPGPYLTAVVVAVSGSVPFVILTQAIFSSHSRGEWEGGI